MLNGYQFKTNPVHKIYSGLVTSCPAVLGAIDIDLIMIIENISYIYVRILDA